MKDIIYLDYNATTPVDKRVLEEMFPYFSEKFGNAASHTHAYGWEAAEAVKTARQKVASLINCLDQEIVFTSGATEAINLALKGIFEVYKNKGNHIVTVKTEHKAVLDTCKTLEKKGAHVTYLSVDREGLIDLNELTNSITEQTILVCVMLANNETGVIQPIKKIADIVHAKGSILMSDATQAIGKIPVDVIEESMDLLCLSAHKFYGPKGIGALYIRRKSPRVTISALIEGGGHERGIRSGTLNVPGIVGLGKACELAENELWEDSGRMSDLRTQLEQALISQGNVHVNGSQKNRLPNTTNLSFTNIKSERLITKVPSLALATGSACTSAHPEPSHVLKAMGGSGEMAYSSVRFSIGKFTTAEEIKIAIEKIKNAVADLRK